MYSRILWMNDLSRRSDACLEPVLALASLQGATVTLAHAAGSRIQGRPRGADDAILPAIRAQAQEHLGALQAQLQQRGVDCALRIEAGKAEHVAPALLADVQADLVVAGATGVTGLDRLLLGSNAIRFMRSMPVPVLVVGRRTFRAVQALLCPVDIDHAPNNPSIAHAAALAHESNATLTFLTVLTPASRDQMQDTEDRLRDTVQRILGAPLPPHWRARAIIDHSTVEGILKGASTHDVVVMSKQGKTGLERLLTGSLAESVVKSCIVSVLVAR